MTAASGIVRAARGSGHSYTIDGSPVPGVTTILKTLDKPALIDWAARTTAEYALDHWAELGRLAPSKRLDALRGARFAENRRAIATGKRVHTLAEALVAGAEVDVPEELAGYVEAYVRFLDEWQIEPLLTEAVVASRRYRYCGTLDVLARVPALDELWLFDVKTGKGVYPETGLQLAAYASAEVYVDADGEHPMPHVHRLAAVHVRPDGYAVRRFPPVDELFPTFAYLAAVERGMRSSREWMSEELDRPVAS
jgi:hypothetical protein